MSEFIFADSDGLQSRRGFVRGTVLTMRGFASGGGASRTTLPMELPEALRFYDPFREDHYHQPVTRAQRSDLAGLSIERITWEDES